MALKWGIVSAGRISNDFVNALSTLPGSDHKCIAIAARDLKRAKEFADLFGIPRAYGDYDQLAKDQEIEVVYIGNLNPQHYETARLLLENGKHLLVEKPMCLNEKQVKGLVDLAQSKNLFLMEAIWPRFFPSYQYVLQQVKSGNLGDVKSVQVDFGFKNHTDDRLAKKNFGGGTVIDMGVYVIQLSQFIFRQPPKSIVATGTLNEEGVDTTMQAEFKYENGGVAKVSTSSFAVAENAATITGTKGQIKIIDFWAPTTIVDIDETTKTWRLPEAKNKFFYINSAGLRFEAEEVRKCIRAGKTQSETVPHEESLLIARIEDEIRRQIGVKYDVDE